MRHHALERLADRILLDAGGLAAPSLDVLTVQPVAPLGGDALAASALGHMEHGGMDPVLAAEHQRLLELLPHDDATHRAVADGDWSDPSTWVSGEVPGDSARVLIPSSTIVRIDDELDARLDWVRVDGHLCFATDATTRLDVETLVVSPTGLLEVGTPEAPIDASVTARINILDSGPIDTEWDPTLVSRGLISHGHATIHGAAKSGPTDLLAGAAAGANELRLASPVEGWAVGDRVLVPGIVRPTENSQGVTLRDEDEVVVISSVSDDGLVIGIETPLAYDHTPPDARLVVPIANLDRNVVLESENKTEPSRAGHVMFMHNPDVSVAHAAFRDLGRNDKSVPTTDPQLDEAGRLIPGTGDNPRGRYAVHFHRTGTNAVAAPVTGSVVENSPGWGFVNHDSHVVMRENVSYNVKGAGFVTEVGSERGAFIDNLAVRSVGKNFYQPLAGSDKGDGEGFGSTGHGFWLQSSGVDMIGNVAAGHAQEGIFINNRTIIEPGRDEPTYAPLTDVPVGAPLTYNPRAREPEIVADAIRPDQTPLGEFRGNDVFASGAGLAVRWRRQEPAVAEGDPGDVIEDFRIWNVEWAGVHLGYVSGLTLRNGIILGDIDSPIPLSTEEALDRGEALAEFHESGGKGIAANRNSRNLVYEDLEIGGFAIGIQALTQGHTRIDSVRLQNVENLVVVTPQSTSQSDGARRIDATNVVNVPLSDEALAGQTAYNVRMLKQIVRVGVAGGSTPADEFAAFTANDEVYYNGYRLYFDDQAAAAVPFASGEAPMFMQNNGYATYLDLTNEQLADQFGLALSGSVAPPEAIDARESLGIHGLAVQLVVAPIAPSPVVVRHDAPSLRPIWFLGDATATVEWQTQGLAEDAFWRVYLSGADGVHEVGRSPWPESRGRIAGSEASEGWQDWRFGWRGDGNHRRISGDALAPGKYTMLASVDGGPSIYLGEVTLIELPTFFFRSTSRATSALPSDPEPVRGRGAAPRGAALTRAPLDSREVLLTLDEAIAEEADSALDSLPDPSDPEEPDDNDESARAAALASL